MQSGNSNSETMGDFEPDQGNQQSRSAFPRLSTNPLIQEAIENGEISKSDIDLLERAQRLSGMGQTLGFVLGSVGGFLAVRRLRPQAKFGPRFSGFFFGGMLGSFAGFISGSVAGAMDVKSKMPDANRKLARIAQITQQVRDQRREEVRQRQLGGHLPPPVPGSDGQSQTPRSFPSQSQASGQRPYPDGSASPSSTYYPRPSSDSSWSGTYTDSEEAENRREQAGEMDRQKNYRTEIRDIERDSQMSPLSSPFDRDPAPSDAGYGRPAAPPIGRPQAGGSAWDRLRQGGTQAVGRARTASAGESGSQGSGEDASRSKEQREFDEMLDRERRGEGETGSWK